MDFILEEDFIIYISDARAYFGGCVEGWKKFCVKNNIDFRDVIANGVPASVLLATGDGMATDLVRYTYERRIIISSTT